MQWMFILVFAAKDLRRDWRSNENVLFSEIKSQFHMSEFFPIIFKSVKFLY